MVSRFWNPTSGTPGLTTNGKQTATHQAAADGSVNPEEMRRGATETKAKVNRGKFRSPGQRNAKEQQRNKNRELRRGGCRQEFAVGQKSHRAGMTGIGGTVMEILVERRADGQGGREQPGHHQQSRERWFGNPADAQFFLIRLQFNDNQPDRSYARKSEDEAGWLSANLQRHDSRVREAPGSCPGRGRSMRP